MNNYVSKEPRQTKASGINPSIGEVVESTLVDRLSEVHVRIAELSIPDLSKVEAVHQLRVASRRAEAALDFFPAVIDKPFRLRAIKQLKKLRSGLGNLRDLDVLLERISDQSSKGSDRLRGLIRDDYDRALQKMEPLARKFVLKLPLDDPNLQARIRRSARELATKPFQEWAVRLTQKIARRFLTSLERADLTAQSLHRLRIRGKKLRYSLELLQPIVPEVLESSAYQRLQKLQTDLGELQDGIVQREILKRLARSVDRRGVRRIVKEEFRKRKRTRFKLLRRLDKLRTKPHRKTFKEELESLLSPSRT